MVSDGRWCLLQVVSRKSFCGDAGFGGVQSHQPAKSPHHEIGELAGFRTRAFTSPQLTTTLFRQRTENRPRWHRFFKDEWCVLLRAESRRYAATNTVLADLQGGRKSRRRSRSTTRRPRQDQQVQQTAPKRTCHAGRIKNKKRASSLPDNRGRPWTLTAWLERKGRARRPVHRTRISRRRRQSAVRVFARSRNSLSTHWPKPIADNSRQIQDWRCVFPLASRAGSRNVDHGE